MAAHETARHLPKAVSASLGFLVSGAVETSQTLRELRSSPPAALTRVPKSVLAALRDPRGHYEQWAANGDAVLGIVGQLLGRGQYGRYDVEQQSGLGEQVATPFSDGPFAEMSDEELASMIVDAAVAAAGGSPRQPREDESDTRAEAEPEASEEIDTPPTPAERMSSFEVPDELRRQAGPLREHDELPLPEFDHMTLGSLRGRLRSLDAVSLVQLLDYEQAHANRVPIVQMLENRLGKLLAAGDTETGAPQATAADVPPATPAEGPSRRPGPPQNPPSQGVPTNPAQPR